MPVVEGYRGELPDDHPQVGRPLTVQRAVQLRVGRALRHHERHGFPRVGLWATRAASAPNPPDADVEIGESYCQRASRQTLEAVPARHPRRLHSRTGPALDDPASP